MIRRGVLTALLIALAGPLAAQDSNPRPPDRPSVAQDRPMQGPPMPPLWSAQAETEQEFAACRLALSLMGTSYTVEPALTDPADRDCGIARPLRVTRIIPGVTLTGNPVMRCDTARSIALWTQQFLRPAAALLDGAPQLTALQTGPAFSCRDRVGTGVDVPKQSEHAYGSAVDIMGFDFDDGTSLTVQPRVGDGNQAESFLRAARGTACLLFTTVLGPGANAAHDNHLHLDMAARNNGWRLCE
ncbi:extensin family protein [Paracoccus sp. JM45]|uniref:extensin-like domain-containing protein n=1 Tax=Paracoccus sp. JM45 TaxID=2283626 RepID=UPI000E6C6076|nr:extensin family protein [Paracoccus sp. JM45]RJE80362.1 extensin [Paracoccus sp. JM45]